MEVLSVSTRVKQVALDWVVWIFLGVFSLSLALNVSLGWRLRSLEQHAYGLSRIKRTQAQIGMFVPSLVVHNLSGDQQTLELVGKRPTVLYVFSPSCIWCEKNLENIRYIASQKHDGFVFIGLSNTPDGLSHYLVKKPLSFPIYVGAQPTNWNSIDYEGTPQTLVIGKAGVVEHNWPGAYVGQTQAEIESFFGLSLPGAPLSK